jgi:hypothetical protein
MLTVEPHFLTSMPTTFSALILHTSRTSAVTSILDLRGGAVVKTRWRGVGDRSRPWSALAVPEGRQNAAAVDVY